MADEIEVTDFTHWFQGKGIGAKVFDYMIGKTITEICGCENGTDEVRFKFSDGTDVKFFHYADCCESVYVVNVDGDIQDLIGSPLVMAEEVSSVPMSSIGLDFIVDFASHEPESWTWTFYKFATVKGYVTISWLGESNGYYSEEVAIERS